MSDGFASRRTVLQSLGLAAGLGIAGTGYTVTAHEGSHGSDTDGTSWPQFSADAANTGHMDGRGPKANPSLDWRFDAVDDSADQFRSPVVADDSVVVASNQFVFALDGDGDVRWRVEDDVEVDGDHFGPPAVADGTVYVGYSVYEGEKAVLALDGETGEEQWRTPLDFVSNFAPATVTDDSVYVVAKSNNDGQGAVHALDRSDGTERWSYDLPLMGPVAFRTSSVAVAGDTVFVPGEELAALDAETGETRWTADDAETYQTRKTSNAPAVADDTVYVGYGGNESTFAAYDAATGEERWSYAPTGPDGAVLSTSWTSAAVVDDTVYAATPLDDERSGVFAFDAADGTVRWQTVLVGDVRSPAVVDGVVYVGSVALDAVTGRTVFDAEDSTGLSEWDFAPAVADGTLFLCGRAVRAISGAVEMPDELGEGGDDTLPTGGDDGDDADTGDDGADDTDDESPC